MEAEGKLDKREARSQHIHTPGDCRITGSWLWRQGQPEYRASKRPKGNFCEDSQCPVFGMDSLSNPGVF